jgi:uncharacterized protein YcbK (DUF882 family)
VKHQQNLQELQKRINNLQNMVTKVAGFYWPFVVNSGYRSPSDQQRINPKAMKSNHLTGSAVDLRDADGTLKELLKNNVDLLEECQLWCEDFKHTPTWVHLQILPPRSGKRFFIP